MLCRLRTSVLTHILSSSSFAFPSNPALHRLLSATAAPNPSFAVGDYLVDTCGLTEAQAIKATAKLSRLKSPAKPDAVLAFLAGLGVSRAAVAAAVAKDPRLLCAGVDKTLAPVVAGLTGLGLSRLDIARLFSLAGDRFRYRSIVPKLRYYLPLFGSSDNLFRALKCTAHLTSSLDKVVKPNVVLLRECGLCDSDIAKVCLHVRWMLNANPERVRAMVACAEGLGVPRGSGMFRCTLQAVAFLSPGKIAAKVEFLKKTFRWSDAQVRTALSKAPMMLRRSEESLQLKSDSLISELGLEPAYIAQYTTFITCSLEGRIKPRHYVVKFLKVNGLLDRKWSYSKIVIVGEKEFVDKFISPHKEAAPHLAEDYLAACRGEAPARLMFASTKTMP